ncbi:MAG: hypothetical protein U9R42_12820 [Bacteroidota bacterium]|nr:hypothetical protein [Bacteroidota bacterium]
MTGNDIKAFATAGVLKQVKLEDDKLVNAINIANIELHKKFRLTINEQYVLMAEATTIYQLNEDCLHVVEVYNQRAELFDLNNEYDLNTISTISYNQIQVSNPIPGEYLSVIYQASPPLITSLDDTIAIPYTLLTPMLHYIGYVLYGGSSGDLDGPSAHHLQAYTSSCNMIIDEGLITPDNGVLSSVCAKGYV